MNDVAVVGGVQCRLDADVVLAHMMISANVLQGEVDLLAVLCVHGATFAVVALGSGFKLVIASAQAQSIAAVRLRDEGVATLVVADRSLAQRDVRVVDRLPRLGV